MIIIKNMSDMRPIEINFNYTAGKVSPDGIKAAVRRAEELEKKHLSVPQDDIAAATTVLTGATPYMVYVYTLTVNFTTGVYDFVFVESAPNTESLS